MQKFDRDAWIKDRDYIKKHIEEFESRRTFRPQPSAYLDIINAFLDMDERLNKLEEQSGE